MALVYLLLPFLATPKHNAWAVFESHYSAIQIVVHLLSSYIVQSLGIQIHMFFR